MCTFSSRILKRDVGSDFNVKLKKVFNFRSDELQKSRVAGVYPVQVLFQVEIWQMNEVKLGDIVTDDQGRAKNLG